MNGIHSKSMKDTQTQIHSHVATIQTATQSISKNVEKIEEPTKSKIDANLGTINSSAIAIDEANKNLNDFIAVKHNDDVMIAKQNEKILKQEQQIKKLNDEKYGLLSKMLAVVAGISIVFSVASIFVLGSPKWAAFGGVLFSVCVAAQWLLNYALYVGLASIAIIGVSVYFILRKERNATRDVVLTVEAIKPYVPTVNDFKTAANNIQSFATQQIVDTIKRKQL
jgi:hypothetical protein